MDHVVSFLQHIFAVIRRWWTQSTSRWSLRARVMLVVSCAHLGIATMAAGLLILNARDAIEDEIQASLDLTTVLLLFLYLLLGRALRPITTIAASLEELEKGHYSVQLPAITVPDLHRIGLRVNALSNTLDTTTRDRDKLGRQLVTLQDDERKLIAMELHDEFGPCLFGIRVDARYVDAASQRIAGKDGTTLAERAHSILSIVDRLQQQSRSMLKRLRPMALGKAPIGELLEDLVASFATREPKICWSTTVPHTQTIFGETPELTLYRMAQECLTNAARHAQATRVNIELLVSDEANRSTSGAAVMLCVVDNGKGLPDTLHFGRGLSGMQQRVQILGGQFEITEHNGGGTRVCASVPLQALSIAQPIDQEQPA